MQKISRDWQQDSTGCDNIRSRIISEKSLTLDSLIGLKVKLICKYLGTPNFISCINSTHRLFYYVDCKYAPVPNIDKLGINNDAEKIYIEFGSDSIVKDCGGMKP